MRFVYFVLGALIFVNPLAFGDSQPANACPTGLVKGLSGTFRGTLAALAPDNRLAARQNVSETHALDGCRRFTFDIRYSDPVSGRETRRVAFDAVWDDTSNLFRMKGEILEGTLALSGPGTYVTSFETRFDGKPAHCEETISVTNRDTQMIRTVHCFAGGVGGASLGVRVIQGTRE